MHWIIDDYILKEKFSEKLLSFLSRVDLPYSIISDNDLDHYDGNDCIAFGTYPFVLDVKNRGWNPGVFLNDNYDYRIWSKKYSDFCLNIGQLCTLADVPKMDHEFFIRPCADTKEFTGTVLNWDQFTKWRLQTKNSLDLSVVVSDVRNIVEEYRFVIVDGRVITGSLYKSRSTGIYHECRDRGLIEFVQSVVDVWTPSEAFVLDIALSNGVSYVLEMGCLNAAGLYACDIQKIVIALEELWEKSK